jgi:TolB protein
VSKWVACSLACLALVAGDAATAEERIAFLGQAGSYWQVWTVKPDGSEPRQLTRSSYEKSRVSWFPDGRRLLIVSIDGHLFEADAQSGEEKPLVLPLLDVHDASASPDGTWLAVAASTGGSRDTHDIWLIRPSGADQRRLVSMPWLQHEPRWSRDGQWVYFLSGDGQQDHDIWRARASDGSTEQLTIGSRYHFEIDVAADGAIAFSSNRSGDYEIYTRPAGGGELTRWTTSPGMDGHPAWSPDGKSLAFHSTRGGRLELWRQDGPGVPAQPLTHLEGGARDPEWFEALQ